MPKLSETDLAREWLSQFSAEEHPVAAKLADAVMLVGRDELYRGLRQLLDALISKHVGPDQSIALYSERKVEALNLRRDGERIYEIQPIFPGSKHGRATGVGVAPVLAENQEIGSEGAIASFVTSYERRHRGIVVNHPGPDDLRDKRVCVIVIVTDFIGSGKRVWEMIEAFWQVATIRSWKSYRLIKFAVVAYTGTDSGIAHVKSHRVKPEVLTIHGCPTITNSFDGADLKLIDELCRRRPKNERYPFGFRDSGALIAFSHGMPNNAPALFHRDRPNWRSLFPNRSTIDADKYFPSSNASELSALIENKLRIRTVHDYLDDPEKRRWIITMLILSSIEEGSHGSSQVSANTRLPLDKVNEVLGYTRIARWTSAAGALTTLGRRELIRLRQRRQRIVELPTEKNPFYYPTQLRAR